MTAPPSPAPWVLPLHFLDESLGEAMAGTQLRALGVGGNVFIDPGTTTKEPGRGCFSLMPTHPRDQEVEGRMGPTLGRWARASDLLVKTSLVKLSHCGGPSSLEETEALEEAHLMGAHSNQYPTLSHPSE